MFCRRSLLHVSQPCLRSLYPHAAELPCCSCAHLRARIAHRTATGFGGQRPPARSSRTAGLSHIEPGALSGTFQRVGGWLPAGLHGRCFRPFHFHTELRAEMPNDATGAHFHRDPPAQQLFKRSHSFTMQAAGNNPIEEAEISVYIEGKAVRGDPSRHMHSHGYELVIAHPDASRSLGSACTNSKFFSNANKDFFQRVHVPGQISPVLRQVEDGVSN